MSKMTKKKKIVLISVLTFVAAILITAAILVGLIFRPADIPTREELGFETVCYELPDDNDPTAHTGVENIGYMNWRLQHQSVWYSETHVFVDNSTDDQNVATYKQYHDGVLISTDISKSNLVNKAMQYCQVRGKDVVLFRNSKGGKSTFDGVNTPWKTEKPDGHTIADYKLKKGLPPLEFSVYIINEDTVKEYTDVIDNGDGTYSQTLYFNFESEPAEKDATYWYKTEMVYKANGMMKAEPQFSEVSVTYTFDDTWQLLSTKTREVYKTFTGVGGINCVAEGETKYTYDNEELSYNPEFENFYKNYMEDYEVPEDVVVDAALCLAEAFGGVMQEESKFSLDLALGENEFSGNIQLNLEENDIRVDFGDVKAYMLTEGEEQYLYISYGENIKAKIALSDLAIDAPVAAAAEGESENVLDNLLAELGNDEKFTLADDGLSATLTPTLDLGKLLNLDLELVLNLEFKFNISEKKEITLDYVKANGDLFDSEFKAELRFVEEGVAPLTQAEADTYTLINSDLVPAVLNLVDVISSQQLSVSGSVEVGGVAISVDNLAISWVNGVEVAAQLTLQIDDFQKSIYIEYNSEKIALYYDGIVVELAQTDVESFAAAVQNLYAAIAADSGEDETAPDMGIIDRLLALLPAGGEDVDIVEIINSIKLTKNDSGNLVIEYGVITVEIVADVQDGIGLNLTYVDEINEISVNAGVTVTGYRRVELPENSEKLDVAELIPLIENITEIITNKGITVSGKIMLDGSTALTLYGLSVSWENGIELQLDARLEVNESVHDFYAEYSATTGKLVIAYGALNSGAGIDINVEEDVQTLEDALVTLFNRIAGVANNMAGEDVLPQIGSLSDLLDLISTGKDAASGVAELADMLDEIQTELPSIGDILGAIQINAKDGTFTVDFGGLMLTVWRAEEGFNLSVQTAGVSFEILDLQIIDTCATDFEINVEKALSAEDIADILDYVAATVELLVADTLKIELSGTVTTLDEAYAEQGGIKYNIEAGFEYVQGESGYPVHIDPEIPDFWIAPDIYVHVYVNMQSTLPEVDSVLFDAYIFDGAPTISEEGKTTADELTSGDNELDIYLSISRIPAEQAENEINGAHEPLKIYAPMNEVMTVLAAGLALVDVGSISVDALPEINDTIVQIGAILDTMLVDRYFADTKDQFTSLGSSLLETILGGSISDLLNDLLNGLMGSGQPEEEVAPTAIRTIDIDGLCRERQGLINLDVTRDEGNSTLTLVVGETTSTVTKQSIENGSRITNLTVDTSALNDVDRLNDLNINLSYGEIEKVEKLAGYTSFVGADELVKALINSATHEVPEEEQTEENPAKYALNNSFFIDGELGVTVNLMGFNLTNHIVTIDGLYVAIDENGEVEVNARLHYSGKAVLVTLVNGNSTVDLTIKNGMVYIKRVQTTSTSALSNKNITPITIYRAMPIDVFMGDIMNQIFFILNFNESIAGMIPSGGDDGGDSEPELKKDYGTQLAEYFNYLTFTEDAEKGTARWIAQLNGIGLSNLAGIDLSDITATFNAERDTETDNYVVKGLGLKGALFGMLQFNANLNWQNPQQNWRVKSTQENEDGTITEITAEGTANDIVMNNPSVKMTEWMGGTTYEEICKSIDWSRLPTYSTVKTTDDNGETYNEIYRYFELTFTGDAELPSGDVKFGTAEYYYQNIDGEEILLYSVENILYYSTTLLSIVETPDLTEYEIEHYTLEWRASSVSGGLKFVAVYVPEQYEVTFVSEYEIEGYTHTYGNTLTFDFTYETDWHKIAYIEYKGEQYTAENYTEIVIDGNAEIYVHWVEIPRVTVTFVSEYEVEGFAQNEDGKWVLSEYYRTDKEITLPSEYVIEGYDFVGYVDDEDNTVEVYTLTLTRDITYFLQWKGNKITVIYYSALQFGDSVEEIGVDGYETAYTSRVDMSNDYTVANVNVEGYMFLGWYYLDEAAGWGIVLDVLTDIHGATVGATYELHALWAVVTIDGSGSVSTTGSFSKTHSYTVAASVRIETLGHSDLISKTLLSSAKFNFSASSGKVESTSSEPNADGSISVEGVKFSYSGGMLSSAEKTVNLTVTFDIAVEGVVAGSWSKSSSFGV